MNKRKIPKKLQPILWSVNVNHLDLNKDKEYIIHQVLIYGTLSEIKWLFDTYSKKDITKVFINSPSKNYPRVVFLFVKNFILKLRNKILNEEKYVTSIHGTIRQRAS